MNLNQLVYFYVVGKTGNYHRAADEVGVSQPAIYKSVNSLERACGVKLLEWRAGRLFLTKVGTALYEYAAEVAALETLAEQAVVAEKEPVSGHISIAVGTHIGTYLLPKILKRWLPQHPGVTLSVVHCSHREMEGLLLAEQVDFALSYGSSWGPGLQAQPMPIFSDSLVVAAPIGHRLVGANFVSVKDLTREQFIVATRGTPSRAEIDLIEAQYGVRFRVVVEVNRHDTIKHLCRAGIGVAVLPKAVVIEEVENGHISLLNVEGFPRSRPCVLVYRKGKAPTPQMKSLLNALERARLEKRG
ncbi:MAG: LysR family transcriptional regulator [Chloroflexota bacterium]